MLPPENEFLSYFLDSFILYQPKDIISGDFYWFTRAGDYRIFACADCTGHGVPGALMSMIGMNYLSHIVNDKDISSPDHALLELDKKVRAALKQDTDNESKDGMDIALCSFHPEKRILHYGGANRPMILIRNGELKEISPSKFAIGGPYNPNKKFEYHTFNLEKNDILYFFSDGITDQFGGPKGKKITKRKFLDFLLENHLEPMALQKFKLHDFFENWKGILEQVDDVCVMGIRI
jgi:serine phosphatase RsbU (regulator of sigma subunit)